MNTGNCNNKLKILKGRNIIINNSIKEASVLVRNGIICGIKEYNYEPTEEFDLLISKELSENKDIVIMGGLVDSHVHVNEPGRTEWEGFVCATSAAAAGGVTTIIDMPLNSSPVTTSLDSLNKKIEAMKDKLRVDVGLLGGIVPGNSNEIKRMVLEGGVVGFKSFLVHSGIDEFPHVQETDIQEAMEIMKSLAVEEGGRDVVMMFHAEIGEPIEKATAKLIEENADPRKYNTFLQSRPREAENIAINMILELSKKNNVRTHIVHLSSSDILDTLDNAIHKEKIPITAETTFHYLYFVSEKVPDGETLYKCCPPVREEENKELLWQALQRGTINIIVSDHSPCTLELKLVEEGDFMKAWGGISSLQLGLPIIWTEAKKRDIPIHNLSKWMSDEPARLVGLNDRKGSIKIGRDADFVVWNPKEEFVVDQDKLMVKNKHSPYHQQRLFGIIYETILRGDSIFKKDQERITKVTGQRLIQTKIHTNPTYPKPFLPTIELLNSLDEPEFFNCIHLLFEAAPPLATRLYAKKPFRSYQELINEAESIIGSLGDEDKIVVINAHPRIGLNPAEIKKTSSISFREQGLENEKIDERVIEIYSTLKTLNEQYEKQFGFKFVEFVNGRSKEQIIPVLRERLNNSKDQELKTGLKAMTDISNARLSKLIQQ
ncbi:hypothetical protein DICPUDRAFT_57406 [Dictyostelium purpureum]|uniref:allantoinase n=1 Tax=Dictyostelium purpureum TaxID=5786 RepID=F0ZVS5_DICPU|nr:uncharacterized protein DICPUDRAFT_57406 [Dictyostelium purpureum]EGC31950.1 hypothetical protein DICPUDRAFT_57406 [Dictyostelium purpureum]|eukprot:XP_003291519.1 hypothetical protein DICPUDRAFT_57406 [Dictyostelium purpureum]